MTIGNGLIANGIDIASNKVLLFASGVSNSNETNPDNFSREKELLMKTIKNNPNKIFIYISSCYVENSLDNREYYTHKFRMEEIVQTSVSKYYIFRLPQVVGKSSNKNTLFNFLIYKIDNNIQFNIWTCTKRNLIDIDDVNKIVNYIIRNNIYINNTINIASPYNYSILEIVNKIEKLLGKKAIYKKQPRGHAYKIDISKIDKFFLELNLGFDKTYLDRLVLKYGKHRDKINEKA